MLDVYRLVDKGLGNSAWLIAPADADLDYPHEPIREQMDVDLGGLVLRPLATPGHTPELLAYLLLDDGRPEALFSGAEIDRDEYLQRRIDLYKREMRLTADSIPAKEPDMKQLPTHDGGASCTFDEQGAAQRDRLSRRAQPGGSTCRRPYRRRRMTTEVFPHE